MISIITPVLNGSKFIQSNIESIQELEIPFEHIVVDGGSTDGTIGIIERYPQVKLVYQEGDQGMYEAINQGIQEASGQYLTWINADDKPIPHGYYKMYSRAVKESADFIYSHGLLHFIEKFYYKKKFAKHFTRYLLKEGLFPFVQPSVIFSRKAYEKVGGLNYEDFELIGDKDLFQRMAYDDSLKFLFVPVFSSVFIRYSDSLLYRNLEKRKKEYKHCIKTNPSLFNKIIYHLSHISQKLLWPFKK